MRNNFILPNYSIFMLVSILLLIETGCSTEPNKKSTGRVEYIIPDSINKKLIIDTVNNCQLIDAITLNGTVDFDQDHQVNIYPLVSGNIQDLKVQVGDYVSAGQVLAIVKSSEMAGYSSNLINAEANLRVAKKNLDAQKDLFASGLASQLDITSAEANYDQAIAQLQMVNRILKINGNNTNGDYIIKAPISGFIVQKNITNNTAIRSDNATSLFTISDLKNVWIQANVYESNISKVHLGDDVSITTVSYPNKIFKGKIDKILNVLDPTNKVMKVRIILSNDNYLLKPQMFTRVVVTNKENRQSLCIPNKGLIFDHSENFVLVYKGNGIAEIRHVHLINTINDKTYLLDGVNVGEKIVGSDALLIYDALNN